MPDTLLGTMIRQVMPVRMPPDPGLDPAAVLADMNLKIEQMVASRDMYAAAQGLNIDEVIPQKVSLGRAAAVVLASGAPNRLKSRAISDRIRTHGPETHGVKRGSTDVSTALGREGQEYGVRSEGDGRNKEWWISVEDARKLLDDA